MLEEAKEDAEEIGAGCTNVVLRVSVLPVDVKTPVDVRIA